MGVNVQKSMKTQAVLLFIGIFLFAGCMSLSKANNQRLQIPNPINKDPEKTLTPQLISEDISQVKYALNTAYSGKRFLPSGEFKKLEIALSKINGKDAKAVCDQIQNSFYKTSDAHLSAFLKGKCGQKVEERHGAVGANYFNSKSEFWDVHIKSYKGKKILLLSILSFPNKTDSGWNGFLEKVTSHLKQVDGVILDIRGNGGGDDSKGYDLASLFAGQPPKTPYTKQWTSRTPEAMQLFINSFTLRKRIALRDGKPSKHFESLIQIFERKRDLAVEGKLPEHPFLGEADLKREEFDFEYEKSIKKPVYILIDAECGSSCESTTDFFEFNPLVTTVGENTAGYIHFGNNGLLVLKHSGIVIQMAVSYNAYKDGRFLEKKGISPEVKVPAGQNAMDVALDKLVSVLEKKN